MDKSEGQVSDFGKQKTAVLHWDDARVFLAVARSGTLSAAAKMLGLGLATASRRLERLEAALAVVLFTRDQGGHRLTDDGMALVSKAEMLEQAGHSFGAEAMGRTEQVAGHVRLATAQGLADYLIIPALPQLLDPHPDLTLEIVTGVTTVNLHRRDADLAIRMVKPESGNVSIRRLGVLGFGLYASSSYLQRRLSQDDASSFEADAFIGWSENQQHLPAAKWLERTLHGRPYRLTTSTLSAQVAATRAGLGMAVLPHYLAQAHGLTCLREDLGVDQPIWLAIHADLAHSRRVRVVADFLCERVHQQTRQLKPGSADTTTTI
ncbi:LysR family transcriptional regulator [Acerihabitans sp. TG2]|uniref:LysR family transcriptional regulator n=1 Tax=Acerihabitans sp. TG2 TaxID=3096008 RepID=UPI002B236010|nr:LysR family transcriptional regulator [Acerihabitans sp. TG2]MEA9392360.1 LysR family transcriptional regulator [Acerihabitans sp. TG2]